MNARPLHVLVAEKLGWRDITNLGPRQFGGPGHTPGEDLWMGREPDALDIEGFAPIPPFGQNSWHGWACTGPLMEKMKMFKIGPSYPSPRWYARFRCACSDEHMLDLKRDDLCALIAEVFIRASLR
jgi:hypothetical protein